MGGVSGVSESRSTTQLLTALDTLAPEGRKGGDQPRAPRVVGSPRMQNLETAAQNAGMSLEEVKIRCHPFMKHEINHRSIRAQMPGWDPFVFAQNLLGCAGVPSSISRSLL